MKSICVFAECSVLVGVLLTGSSSRAEDTPSAWEQVLTEMTPADRVLLEDPQSIPMDRRSWALATFTTREDGTPLDLDTVRFWAMLLVWQEKLWQMAGASDLLSRDPAMGVAQLVIASSVLQQLGLVVVEADGPEPTQVRLRSEGQEVPFDVNLQVFATSRPALRTLVSSWGLSPGLGQFSPCDPPSGDACLLRHHSATFVTLAFVRDNVWACVSGPTATATRVADDLDSMIRGQPRLALDGDEVVSIVVDHTSPERQDPLGRLPKERGFEDHAEILLPSTIPPAGLVVASDSSSLTLEVRIHGPAVKSMVVSNGRDRRVALVTAEVISLEIPLLQQGRTTITLSVASDDVGQASNILASTGFGVWRGTDEQD